MPRPPLRRVIPTMSNRITNLGFPANIFNAVTYLLAGYTDKDLASLLRILWPFTDDQNLKRVLLVGVKFNFFTSFTNCQPEEFYSFLKYLRTPQGQYELRKITVLETLEENAAYHGVTVHEMVSIDLAKIPVSDSMKRKNKNRKKLYEDIIADLENDQLKFSDQQALASFDCDKGNPNELKENVPDGGGSSNAGL
ncbi:hypothetical protein L195_g003160 [Trifolium pratense]|uniref:Uncharacterized protein n=1 Tax=Trifolium pratense TaxID=57577 RepID=A0A2K3NUG8_TRIPR|nr:hypothetical protein L195_g003160 [Trifolium pratense]